jgi:hypothetical protein
VCVSKCVLGVSVWLRYECECVLECVLGLSVHVCVLSVRV